MSESALRSAYLVAKKAVRLVGIKVPVMQQGSVFHHVVCGNTVFGQDQPLRPMYLVRLSRRMPPR